MPTEHTLQEPIGLGCVVGASPLASHATEWSRTKGLDGGIGSSNEPWVGCTASADCASGVSRGQTCTKRFVACLLAHLLAVCREVLLGAPNRRCCGPCALSAVYALKLFRHARLQRDIPIRTSAHTHDLTTFVKLPQPRQTYADFIAGSAKAGATKLLQPCCLSLGKPLFLGPVHHWANL
jgi:hypothetical protein